MKEQTQTGVKTKTLSVVIVSLALAGVFFAAAGIIMVGGEVLDQDIDKMSYQNYSKKVVDLKKVNQEPEKEMSVVEKVKGQYFDLDNKGDLTKLAEILKVHPKTLEELVKIGPEHIVSMISEGQDDPAIYTTSRDEEGRSETQACCKDLKQGVDITVNNGTRIAHCNPDRDCNEYRVDNRDLNISFGKSSEGFWVEPY